MSELHNFAIVPVTCHAWNKERTELALSLNNNEVHLYNKSSSGGWDSKCTLVEHGQRVTSIDWAPQSNLIVTCGADRNAYVWQLNGDKWKPTLVILRINRAATYVRWSPNEDKFAVGSGARIVCVCYFDKHNDWWAAKHIKRPIRSTVTCLDWHPQNSLIAVASTDFKCRVFSGYLKEVEAKPTANNWAEKFTFGHCVAEFGSGGGGWVHSVSFSASGDKLVWVGHDSCIAVVDAAKGQEMTFVKTEFLPFMGVQWVTEQSLVAVGYDCNPIMYSYAAGKLSLISKLDIPKESTGTKFSAMKRFQDLDKKATTEDNSATDVKTLHKNTISHVVIHSGTKSNVTRLSTAGVDGNLVIWDLKSLEQSIADLKIV